MKDSKKISADVLKGIMGGILIAAGSLSAIGFTENAVSCILVVALVIAGAFVGIVLDTIGANSYVVCMLSVILFAAARYFNIGFIEYMASGAVMYMGCVFALPEADVFTNAVTGAAAAAGFLGAVIAII